MLENKSTDFKTLLLLRITKKLIENSSEAGIYKLKKLIDTGEFKHPLKIQQQNQRPTKEDIKKKVKERLNYIPKQETKKEIIHNEKPIFRPQIKRNRIASPIPKKTTRISKNMIYQDDLPENLRYLRPTKEDIQKTNINLKQLNPFILDKNVKTIETEGPDEMIFVTGKMGKKPTGIKMSKEEIDEIINIFSIEGKVPKTNGLFKVLIGQLQLTAIVSESLGSRFIIIKRD